MESEDKIFKTIMRDSKLEMPFSDFDDNVMAKIEFYELNKREALRNRFYASFFFLIGTVFGAILNFFLSHNLAMISSSIEIQENLYWFSQLIYVLMILLFSDKLCKVIRFYNQQKGS